MDALRQEYYLRMKQHQKKFISLTTLIIISTFLSPANAEIIVDSKCTEYGSTTVFNNYIYVCNKVNKKLVWTLVKILNTPTPTSSPTPIYVSITPINDLSANIVGDINVYSFSKPVPGLGVVSYQIGFSYLLDSSKDIKLFSSYSEIAVYKSANDSPIEISLSEMKNYIASKVSNPNGISIMARVRIVSGSVYSSWSNGIYSTSEQINYLPTQVNNNNFNTPIPKSNFFPTPTPTPTPIIKEPVVRVSDCLTKYSTQGARVFDECMKRARG